MASFGQSQHPDLVCGQVEEVMKLSLQEVMQQAVEAYPVTPRKEWVLQWPGQVVLAASQVHWTAEVTQVGQGRLGMVRRSDYYL